MCSCFFLQALAAEVGASFYIMFNVFHEICNMIDMDVRLTIGNLLSYFDYSEQHSEKDLIDYLFREPKNSQNNLLSNQEGCRCVIIEDILTSPKYFLKIDSNIIIHQPFLTK